MTLHAPSFAFGMLAMGVLIVLIYPAIEWLAVRSARKRFDAIIERKDAMLGRKE